MAHKLIGLFNLLRIMLPPGRICMEYEEQLNTRKRSSEPNNVHTPLERVAQKRIVTPNFALFSTIEENTDLEGLICRRLQLRSIFQSWCIFHKANVPKLHLNRTALKRYKYEVQTRQRQWLTKIRLLGFQKRNILGSWGRLKFNKRSFNAYKNRSEDFICGARCARDCVWYSLKATDRTHPDANFVRHFGWIDLPLSAHMRQFKQVVKQGNRNTHQTTVT